MHCNALSFLLTKQAMNIMKTSKVNGTIQRHAAEIRLFALKNFAPSMLYSLTFFFIGCSDVESQWTCIKSVICV